MPLHISTARAKPPCDLKSRLVCGSRGRLALIVRASFRLHPLPKATRTLVVETDAAAAVVARLLASQLQPSALDVLHPGRVALLFEGTERAVEAQLVAACELVGGEATGAEVWDEARRRQGEARDLVRFPPGELAATLAQLPEAVVRPAAGVAYAAAEIPSRFEPQGSESDALRALVERIRRELDPHGVLAG